MPSGLPPAAMLMGRQITLFSLDTSVLQSAGFHFDAGALKVLREQVPDWMRLVWPEVIVREVVDHRMQAVRVAHQEAEGALMKLERSTGRSLDRLRAQMAQYRLLDKSSDSFKKEMDAYANQFRGEVLEFRSLSIITAIFERYFALEPPFGGSKKSKNEFPDAAALVSLEQYAEEKRTSGVLVSADTNWHAFVSKSDSLFCVASLEELTGLYASGAAAAKSAVDSATKAIAAPESRIHQKVFAHISGLLAGASWVVSAVDAATRPLPARVINVSLSAVAGTARRSWVAAHDQALFVVEAMLRATVDVTVEASLMDAAGGLDLQRRILHKPLDMRAFLTVKAQNGGIEKWDADVQVAESAFSLDAGEFVP